MNVKYYRFRGKLKTCADLAEIARGMGSDVTARIIAKRIRETKIKTCIDADSEAYILAPLQNKPKLILLPERKEFTLRQIEKDHGLSRHTLSKQVKKSGKTEFTLEELRAMVRVDARCTPKAKVKAVVPKVIRNINDVEYNPSPRERALLRF